MHRCYLVCYDVRDDKRLRRVFRALKGYGQHWQFSIFFCVLRNIDRVRLQSALEEELNLKEDQAIILDLGPNEKDALRAVTVLGTALPEPEHRMVVI